jgi:signal transduction histidine kinase
LNAPHLLFEIRDNGKGGNINYIKQGHYGIANMKRRVEEIGGSFNIESKQSEGTKILIQIPWR